MPRQSIKQRLDELEARVAELQSLVRANQQSPKDWRRTIRAFTGDAGMQEILKEAMKIREADRAKARAKKSKQCKPRP
jgi:hypothetical protein